MTKEERVSKVLNEFLESQGYSNVVAKYIEVSDCYYYGGGEVPEVVLGGLTNYEADKVFMTYCKEDLGLEVEISIDTLSFLHELGHHNTIDFLDDAELIESDCIKSMLYMLNDESEESFMKYFTCPVEKEATIDAVNFCNHNPEVVQQLDNVLLNVLYED